MCTEKRKRMGYLIAFLALLTTEFLIGFFVHDRFIRPYVGDVLVVILLYAFVRILFPEKPVYLSLGIFLFAVFVEITQLIPLVDLLGIQNRFIRIVMGTSFAWGDMLAYLAGSVINLGLDLKETHVGKGKNETCGEKG